MDLYGFADLWEHVRLLSDQPRNQAMIALLERHAPGARVLEVGCGTGLLSCVAARLGAREVLAVEPTLQAELARALVRANDLDDVVEVVMAPIEELAPRPFDLVVSELLNADPFVEGVLQSMDVAADWVADGGLLAPRRLRLFLALTEAHESADEVSQVRTALSRIAADHDLDLAPLTSGLDALEPYGFLAPEVSVVTEPVCIADLPLGSGDRPPPIQQLEILLQEDSSVGGAVVWFEVEFDDGIVLHNRPGHPGHWGHLCLGWPRAIRGSRVSVEVHLDVEEGVAVRPTS